jgi:hypothetical protein
MIASVLALPVMAGAVLICSSTSVAMAAPEPEPVPRRWELLLEAQPLHVAYANVPGVGSRPFYYMTYKATNVTGTEQTLAVSFELSTGDGNVFRAGRNVPIEVTKQIIEHVGNPLLQDPIGILGPIQHGRENAREGIVIWPLEDFTPDALIVYAAGFSGETATVELPKVEVAAKADAKAEVKTTDDAAKPAPAKDAAAPEAKPAADAAKKTDKADSGKAILRKTKVLEFKVPGEMTNLRDAAIPLTSERWIMR